MKKSIVNLLLAITVVTLSFAFGLGMEATNNNNEPKELPTRVVTDDFGNEYLAVSIEDITSVHKISAVNIFNDKFLQTGTSFNNVPRSDHYTSKGTIKIIILNLNPLDEKFFEKAESLAPFSTGNNWEFSVYVPPVFSASNIYVRSNFCEQIGEIENYDFIEFSEYSKITEEHKDGTRPVTLNVDLYSRRETMMQDPIKNSSIITIHYEAKNNFRVGLSDDVYIGAPGAVNSFINKRNNLYYSTAILSAVVFTLFIFICLLKKSNNFIPHLIMLSGMFGIFLSLFIFNGNTCNFPYPITVIKECSFAMMFSACILSLNIGIKKLKVKYILLPIIIVCTGLAVTAIFVNPLSETINLILRIAYSALSLILCVGFIYQSAKDKNIQYSVSPIITSVGVFYSVIFVKRNTFFSFIHWLFIGVILATLAVGLWQFIILEQKNQYLKNNLRKEIAIQTNTLQTLLNEREEILRYASHDMHKPITSIKKFLKILRNRETNAEQIKTIDIVTDKALLIEESLALLLKYSHVQFLPESSETIDVADVIQSVYNNLKPDCDANGINLHCTPSSVKIYAKRNNLTSIFTNIIINAIEHSECKNIYVSASRRKDQCKIKISDDGVGLSGNDDIFKPDITSKDEDTNQGLGLFICRKYAEAMNGTIDVETQSGLLTFIIMMPLA